MADMTHEKGLHLDDTVTVTRRQLLAAESLLAAQIIKAKALTDIKLSGLIACFNQWLYHPEAIPAFAVAAIDINAKEEE